MSNFQNINFIATGEIMDSSRSVTPPQLAPQLDFSLPESPKIAALNPDAQSFMVVEAEPEATSEVPDAQLSTITEAQPETASFTPAAQSPTVVGAHPEALPSIPDAPLSTVTEAQHETVSFTPNPQSSYFMEPRPGTTSTPQLAGRRIAPGVRERIKVYGYAVTEEWLDQYAFDIGKTDRLERLRFGDAARVATRAHLRHQLQRYPSAVRTIDENGEETFLIHFGIGSNSDESEMKRAYDPENIKKLKEVMRMTEEPKWYYVW